MRGSIYKIVNSKNDKIYIGSTIQSINTRFSKHKSDMNRKNMNILRFMNEIGFEFFNIILIESVEIESKAELLKIEEKYMNEFRESIPDLLLNTIRSYASPENKKKNKHKLYLKHKEGQYSRRRKVITKNKESHDEYKEQCKSYYQQNKSNWKVNNGVKIMCECQREVSKANFNRHLKSPMHTRFLNRYHLSLLPSF